MNGTNDFLFQLDEYYLNLGDDGQVSFLDNEQLSARPFPGLRPFKASEFQLFHGRDGQAEELVKRLVHQHFLAVIGSSGSGKSSLIRAGLIPQLLGGYLQGAGTKWKIAICRPGKDPVENLAIALSRVRSGTNEESKIRDEFEIIAPILGNNIYGILEVNELLSRDIKGQVKESPEIIPEIKQVQSSQAGIEANNILAPSLTPHNPPPSNLLIIIDQFEELFRFERADLGKPGIEKHFVDLLLKAASKSQLPIYVIITMRSEFLGDCSQYQGLPEAINAGQYLVPQIGREQINEVIRDPIKLAGKTIAPGFLELLVNETQQSKARYAQDQLPILQHALMRTYQEAVKKRATEITYEHYTACGGMEKALANHAEAKYMELGDGGKVPSLKQRIAKLVFQALTDTSTDQKGGRRPTSVKVLYAITASLKATTHQVDEVINAFRDADTSFILPPLNVELSPELVVDISHESLMRQWVRLREWVDEEGGYSQLMNRLVQSAKLYGIGQKEVLSGKELAPIAGWYHSFNPQPAWAERYTPDYAKSFDYLLKSESTEKWKHFLTRAAIVLVIAVLVGGLIWVDKHQQHARQDKLAKKQDFISKGESAIQYNDPLIGALLIAEGLNFADDGDSLLQKSNELLPTWYLKDVFKTQLNAVEKAAFSDNLDTLLLWNAEGNQKECYIMNLLNHIFTAKKVSRPIPYVRGEEDNKIVAAAISKLFYNWGIDNAGSSIIIDDSLKLTLSIPNNYHSIYTGIVSPDSSIIFTAGKSKNGVNVGNFYNLSKGNQVSQTMVLTAPISEGVFNKETNTFMTWSQDRSIRIFKKIATLDSTQGDRDFPVTLFKVQLEAVTGAKLNKNNNGLLPIELSNLPAITMEWMQKAEAHYKTCKYKEYNYWAHCFPEKAKVYNN